MKLASATVALLCCLAASSPAPGQSAVQSRHRYERVWCIVPLTGQGTPADPKRPMFTQAAISKQSGIVGWQRLPSDDGKSALAEFAAINRSALEALLSSRESGVRVFADRKTGRAAAEAAFRSARRDFKASWMGLPVF